MSTVLYEKRGRVAILTMNRPDVLNALNQEMTRTMGRYLLEFRDDPEAWVLVVTGGPKVFSVGQDFKELSATGQVASTDPNVPRLTGENPIQLNKPVIAAIAGYAVAGGMEIALGCDIRLAAENAKLGLMEVKRGRFPGGAGAVVLPRVVPVSIAMEMLLTGDPIDAQEAYRIGLVNRVVPVAQLMPEAFKLADRICECAPLSVRFTKEAVYRCLDMPLSQARKEAMHYAFRNAITEDAMEGPRAFAEKRKAVWKGR